MLEVIVFMSTDVFRAMNIHGMSKRALKGDTFKINMFKIRAPIQPIIIRYIKIFIHKNPTFKLIFIGATGA